MVISHVDLKEQSAEQLREDSTEPPGTMQENKDIRPDSVVNIGTSTEPPTMSDTLELLLRRLKDKRLEGNRPDDLNVSDIEYLKV